MEKKYFVISDIHSFYYYMIGSLETSGFEINNPEHILIVCGDVFDRGNQTMEVYNFLKSLPEDRCILIRGNHEQLYFDLLKKNYPESHDFSNGTVNTFCQIAGYDPDTTYDLRNGYYVSYGTYSDREYIDPKCEALWKKIKEAVKDSEVTKWLKSKQWINFYELDKYIFVHSFIPLTFLEDRGLTEDYCIYYGWVQHFMENPDWRKASSEQWEAAAWGCAYKFFDAGLFNQELEKDKVLVCGHYRCSEFNRHYLKEFPDNHEIYFGKNLIAIDATTAQSEHVNVLVIDGNKCYDRHKKLLTPKKPKSTIKTETVK